MLNFDFGCSISDERVALLLVLPPRPPEWGLFASLDRQSFKMKRVTHTDTMHRTKITIHVYPKLMSNGKFENPFFGERQLTGS